MITRFAPSPTGPLHLGHAFAGFVAHDLARAAGGAFLLRIEDIDRDRSKPRWDRALRDDLDWLGLVPDGPVLRQSERLAAYGRLLDRLWDMDLLYPCSCTRRDVMDALSAPQEGVPQFGPDGPIYPGTCRHRPKPARRPVGEALRLDLGKVELGKLELAEVGFTETGRGPSGETGVRQMTLEALRRTVGDVVLSRRDFEGSYHLSVVADDAHQGITLVTRGQDLFDATPIHVLLQRLLEFPTPVYHHHGLVRDESGRRLAKRDDARAIARYREDGATPEALRRMVGAWPVYDPSVMGARISTSAPSRTAR